MSARLRVGLIGSGDNNTNTLLRLLVEQGIHIVYTLTPKDISNAHINEKNLDVWLLDLDDAHWHNNLDELMDNSNVPIFFNEHQSIEQQTHVEYWVRNLISRMEELADDIEMPNTPSASVEKTNDSTATKNITAENAEPGSVPSKSTLNTKEKPVPVVADTPISNADTSAIAASSPGVASVRAKSDLDQISSPTATSVTRSSAEQAASASKIKTAEMHHIAFNAPPSLPSDKLTTMPSKVDADLLREMEELESFLLDKDPAAKVDSFKPLEPIRLQISTSDSPALETRKTGTPTVDSTVDTKPTANLNASDAKSATVAAKELFGEVTSKIEVTNKAEASTPAALQSPATEQLQKITMSTSASPRVAAEAQEPEKKLRVSDHVVANTILAKTITEEELPKSKPKKESIEDLLRAAKTELRGQIAPPSVRAESPIKAPLFTDIKEPTSKPVQSASEKSAVAESVLAELAKTKTSSDDTHNNTELPTSTEQSKNAGKANAPIEPSQEQIVLPTFELDLGFIDESVIDQRLSDSDVTSNLSGNKLEIVEATLDTTLDSTAALESNTAFVLPTLEEDNIPALAMDSVIDISHESLEIADADIGSESQAPDEFALLPTLENTDFATEEFDAIEFEPVEPEPVEFESADRVSDTADDRIFEGQNDTVLKDKIPDGTTNTEQSTPPAFIPSSEAESLSPEIELAVPMLESVAMGAEFEALAPFKPNETPIVAQKKLPCDLWIIGASLGGPAALKRFFGSISEPLPVCFLIAQHIDPHFLPVLGKIVEGANPFYKVEVLTRPGLIEPGTILLAPVEKRLWFLDGAQVVHSPHSWTPPYSPSINDVLLDVAKAYPSQTHTVIFSGMGEDGVDGAKSIHQAGGHVWVQESESCASAVMPDAIFNTGIVSLRDTPEKLAQALMKRYLDKSQSQHG